VTCSFLFRFYFSATSCVYSTIQTLLQTILIPQQSVVRSCKNLYMHFLFMRLENIDKH